MSYTPRVMRGFLLGLSNSTVCLAACVPVLVSLTLSQARAAAGSAALLGSFLAGRLAGYLAFAVIAWSAGLLVPAGWPGAHAVKGAAFLLLGVLLVLQGWRRGAGFCAARLSSGRVGRWAAGSPLLLPAALGVLTGVNLCPPFLLAFTEAAASRSLPASLLFFFTFFLGTSIFFLPFPLLGALHRRPEIATVGRITSVLVGLWYCVSGVLMLGSPPAG